MTGESVAQVVASNQPDYAEGDTVVAVTGWRTHTSVTAPRTRARHAD
jgi:NADPH-dependent curcumin reductase CurA